MSKPVTPFRRWTPTEDATIRKYAGRYSMRAIGAMIGRTKNMVIGRANRLGIVKGYRKFKK